MYTRVFSAKVKMQELGYKPTSFESPIETLQTNIIGTANISALCIKHDIKLIYISTDYVYPGIKGNYKEDYQMALEEYYNRNYKQAIQMFEELLARDSSNSLADNCRYWIGECYYGLGNYNQAIIEFTKVFSFTKSNKMDDAQLKLGLCYWRLGDRDRAVQEFERLVNEYPDSEYVEKAREFLSKLE